MLTAPTSPAATLYAIKVHRFLEVHVWDNLAQPIASGSTFEHVGDMAT
jgi:hypothetical protein